MTDRQDVARGRPTELGAFGALLAMTGLAFAQPVLSSFGDSPETFIFNGSSAGQIVLFALGVVLVPPVVLWLVLRLVRALWPGARATVLALMVGGLAGLFAIGLIGDATDDTRSIAALAAGAVVGVGAALLYRSAEPFRSFLAALVIAPALFLTSFLFLSPTSDLITDGDDVAVVEDVEATEAENLVFIVIDEVPTATLLTEDGDLDAERYPNLAELAGDSTWFRNFQTVSADTIYAVPSILTGQFPEGGATPYWGDHPDNLFTLLGGSFNLNVHESLTALCAPNICEGAEPVEGARGSSAPSTAPSAEGDDGSVTDLWSDAWALWREWVGLRPTGDRWSQFGERFEPETTTPIVAAAAVDPVAPVAAPTPGSNPDAGTPPPTDESALEAANQPARLREFEDAVATTPSPALHFLHLVLPHRPYLTLPDGTAYDPLAWPDVGLGFPAEWKDQWFADLARQRLIWQMQYTDRLVGDVIDSLKAADIYDSSVVVVVGDHGAGFTAGEGFRLPEDENRHEVLWSPFFVKEAHQTEGDVDDTPLRSVDVLPTVADAMGVDVPWELLGSSAFDSHAEHPEDRPFYVFQQGQFQPNPDAVYDTDGAAELARMLEGGSPPTTPALTDWLYRDFAPSALVGVAVDDLRVGAADAPAAASLEPSELGGGEALSMPPAVVTGRIGSAAVDGVPIIALAIDGVIQAVSPVISYDDGDPAFAFAMPTVDAAEGGRPVQLYLVTGDPSDRASIVLTPVARSD